MDFGVIVDLETTGLNPKQDSIIEVGLLEFGVSGDELPRITGTYGGLEDPGQPLPEAISKLTGLTDSLLTGRQVDWLAVRAMLAKASVVIAHNAEFDRAFLAQRSELAGLKLHWACSARHINWTRHGFKTRALNYLAADHRFVNPFAHRAVFDCATTFRLIAPHLRELMERSWLREFNLAATGAPFEAKDLLRQRGYRWDPAARVWWRRLFEDELEAERVFLAAEVYKGTSRHQEEEIRNAEPVVEDEGAQS